MAIAFLFKVPFASSPILTPFSIAPHKQHGGGRCERESMTRRRHWKCVTLLRAQVRECRTSPMIDTAGLTSTGAVDTACHRFGHTNAIHRGGKDAACVTGAFAGGKQAARVEALVVVVAANAHRR